MHMIELSGKVLDPQIWVEMEAIEGIRKCGGVVPNVGRSRPCSTAVNMLTKKVCAPSLC